MRSALTLSPDRGGVFDVLLSLVRHGLGGRQGTGTQFVSWIHEADFVLVLEADVPWIPGGNAPLDNAYIAVLDSDPIRGGSSALPEKESAKPRTAVPKRHVDKGTLIACPPGNDRRHPDANDRE